jgi:hypothetical protein
MYSKSIGADPLRAKTGFAVRDITGRWKSREGAPDIQIYRSGSRRNGGFFMEFAYKAGDIFRRPIKQYYGIWYFDLFGFVVLAYDTEKEVLQLSGYGDYYRPEDEC